MLDMLAGLTSPPHTRIAAWRSAQYSWDIFILVQIPRVKRGLWILLQIGHTVGHGAIWRNHLRHSGHVDVRDGIGVDPIVPRRQVRIRRIITRHV